MSENDASDQFYREALPQGLTAEELVKTKKLYEGIGQLCRSFAMTARSLHECLLRQSGAVTRADADALIDMAALDMLEIDDAARTVAEKLGMSDLPHVDAVCTLRETARVVVRLTDACISEFERQVNG
jgi:hypothetical protein